MISLPQIPGSDITSSQLAIPMLLFPTIPLVARLDNDTLDFVPQTLKTDPMKAILNKSILNSTMVYSTGLTPKKVSLGLHCMCSWEKHT